MGSALCFPLFHTLFSFQCAKTRLLGGRYPARSVAGWRRWRNYQILAEVFSLSHGVHSEKVCQNHPKNGHILVTVFVLVLTGIKSDVL